jgi:hypothetical protein
MSVVKKKETIKNGTKKNSNVTKDYAKMLIEKKEKPEKNSQEKK